MFQASTCPSSGVLVCILCILLPMAFIGSSIQSIQPNTPEFYRSHPVNCCVRRDIQKTDNTPEDGHVDARNM